MDVVKSGFQYNPLEQSSENGLEIRLLCLLPAPNFSAPVECQLRHAHIREPDQQTPVYEALSYVWGDPIITTDITVDGHIFPVTINLEAALRHLRNLRPANKGTEIAVRLLWVDALCIDQSNISERSCQVQKMFKIFETAWKVVAWLGIGDSKTDYAIDALHKKLRWRSPSRGEFAPSTVGMFHLLGLLPWSRRIWIVQEAAAAQQIQFVCGKRAISNTAFQNHFKIFNDVRFSSLFEPVWEVLARKIHLRDRGANWLPPILITDLVQLCHDLNAGDARDNIFALLSMSTEGTETDHPLKADYSWSLQKTYGTLVTSATSPNVTVTMKKRSSQGPYDLVLKGDSIIIGEGTVNGNVLDRPRVVFSLEKCPLLPQLQRALGSRLSLWYALDARTQYKNERFTVHLLSGALLPTVVQYTTSQGPRVTLLGAEVVPHNSIRPGHPPFAQWEEVRDALIQLPVDPQPITLTWLYKFSDMEYSQWTQQ